jgi:predicted unusual protein kinase regulating ubiquinone biosynthesis (AarF/ABC1/UbiB family)
MAASDDPVPRGRFRRTLPVTGFTVGAAAGRMVAAVREKAGDVDAVARFHQHTAERYAELLGHSKGVLMKAGQLLSMIDTGCIGNGQLSPYQKALTRLHTDAPPMDPAVARHVLQTDLGRPVGEVFAEFSDEPMAAASIGQVHRAVLRDGRPVAVKIQYPGAAEAIHADLANTELLATFLRLAAASLGMTIPSNLLEATREIGTRIREELDYRHEAVNISAFRRIYSDHPFIRVPQVISAASGDRVLTMTYLEGIDWAAAREADQHLKNMWAEAIAVFLFSSYRHANLLHADPHCGNYRFGLDGTVGVVDFGCVKVLPELQRRRFVLLSRAVIDGRKQDVHHLMTEMGLLTNDCTLSVEEAYEWWAELLYETLAAQPVTFTRDTARRAIHALLDVRSPEHAVHRISLPDDFVFLPRITLSILAVCTELGATVHARSITDFTDGTAEPVTPLGKAHDAWVRQRRLPYGLDIHERV